MIKNATEGADQMNDPQTCWDSESRKSPFSTVADIEDEFCDECDSDDCHCA